jgi:Domain of unknown function (DUF4262)
MVNEYNRRIRSGEHFREGDLVSGFIEEFGCEFRAVDVSHYHEYFGWDLWLHGDADFRVLQLAYPTTAGVWPRDANANESFQMLPPLLDAPVAPARQ